MFNKIVLTTLVFFIVNFVFAQGGLDPIDPNTIGAPIDGGLSILLVAGAAYGAKKVHDFRTRKTNEQN